MQAPENALVAAGLLFVAMLAVLEIGHRHGSRRAAANLEGPRPGAGVVDGAIFALMGLLLAFTFSGAAARFDQRRTLIVEEANAIGTAYLRLDVLPAAGRDELRASFRAYVDARLGVYRALPDIGAATAHLARAGALQQEIWTRAVRLSPESPPAPMLLLPAINAMIDIASTRTMAAQTHPPTVIFGLLFGLALLSALLAGMAMGSDRRRNWVHMIIFAATLASAVYVIMDLEYPRFGFIRVDAFDRVLVDLRRSMQ
jgi:hypothetical protein